MIRFLIFIFLFHAVCFCKPARLENSCDVISQSFWELTFIKNLINDKSPGCHPYFARNEPQFLTYGVFSGASNGFVIAAETIKDKLYIGGVFDQIAATTGSAAFVWKDSALPIASTYCSQVDLFDQGAGNPAGHINQAIKDPEGNLYILGKFTHVQGYPRRNLAKLNSNCKLDLNFDARLAGTNTILYDLLYLDGRIFVAGDFRTLNGAFTNFPSPTFREHLASLDAKTGLVDSWSPNVTGTDVKRLVTDGQFIYFIGDFTAVNSGGAGFLSKVDKNNGSTFFSMPQLSGNASTLKISNGILYLGGDFTTLNPGAFSRDKLAAIRLSDNTVLPAFSSIVINGSVKELVVWENSIFVAGDITGPRLGLFKTDLNGTVLSNNYDITGNFPGIYKLSIIEDKLYAFGYFDTVRGLDRKNFFHLDLNTDTVTNWDPKFFNANSESQGVALPIKDDIIFLGGGFGALDVRLRDKIAEFDLATGYPTDWNPMATGGSAISVMTKEENTLYFAGDFTGLEGTNQSGNAAYDVTTKTRLPWNPTISGGSVNTMKSKNGSIYLGGNFNQTNGTNTPSLSKVDQLSGSLDSNFVSGVNNIVEAIEFYQDQLLIAGKFDAVPASSRFLASLNPQNGSFVRTHDKVFDLGNSASAFSLFVSGDRLFMSGQYIVNSPFPSISLSAYQLPNLNSISLPQSFGANTNFARSFVETENRIFLGGTILDFSGTARVGLISLDRSNGRLNDWNPRLANSDTVRKILYIDKTIFAFGGISSGGNKYRSGFIKIMPDTGYVF